MVRISGWSGGVGQGSGVGKEKGLGLGLGMGLGLGLELGSWRGGSLYIGGFLQCHWGRTS